jgi:hypothetical protein
MKKLILFFLLFITPYSFAEELHNYNDIRTSIINGKKIRIVMELSQCSNSNNLAHSTMNIGVFTPNAMQVTNDHIVTSFIHFTLNNPKFAGTPVYEYVTYTLYTDNNMKVTEQVLEPALHSPITDLYSFKCKLDAGVKIYL